MRGIKIKMADGEEKKELVIITGMSGAGKTVAMQSFEDMGYFCVDNMPPSLLPKFWELVKESGKITKIALVIDLRSRAFFDEIMSAIGGLDNTSFITTKILFLEASDDALVSRYKETRRTHPLAGEGRIYDGIIAERRLLQDIKTRSQKVIDTTNLSPRQLREEIMQAFSTGQEGVFTIQVMSFGFKYGIPLDLHLMFDLRFLPNPYYIDNLKRKTGNHKEVQDYVMGLPESQEFYKMLLDMLLYLIPKYEKEGKSHLRIGIGCSGGQHRSATFVNKLYDDLSQKMDYHIGKFHREVGDKKEI